MCISTMIPLNLMCTMTVINVMCINCNTTEPDMYYDTGKPDVYSLQYHWTTTLTSCTSHVLTDKTGSKHNMLTQTALNLMCTIPLNQTFTISLNLLCASYEATELDAYYTTLTKPPVFQWPWFCRLYRYSLCHIYGRVLTPWLLYFMLNLMRTIPH